MLRAVFRSIHQSSLHWYYTQQNGTVIVSERDIQKFNNAAGACIQHNKLLRKLGSPVPEASGLRALLTDTAF